MTRHIGPAVHATVLIAGLMGFSGCSGGSGTTTPTTPTVSPTAENFSGTVPVGGNDAHTFTVLLSNGQLNVTLTAAGPPATIYAGIGIGTPSTTGCTLLSGAAIVAPAGSIAQLSGAVLAGTYCVVIYDAGNQTNDITYSVTVTHF